MVEKFGEISNGVGPIPIDAEWRALRYLAIRSKAKLGQGRWLPKPSIATGSCCGLEWFTTTTGGELSMYFVNVTYPNGSTFKYSLRDAMIGTQIMEYKHLVYIKWPVKTGERVLRHGKYNNKSVISYGGTSYVTIDSDVTKIINPDGTSVTFGNPEYVVVSVPLTLVNDAIASIAGEERGPKTIRHIRRTLEAKVFKEYCVPEEYRGLVVSRLANLVQGLGAHSHLEDLAQYVPGALNYNGGLRYFFGDNSPNPRWVLPPGLSYRIKRYRDLLATITLPSVATGLAFSGAMVVASTRYLPSREFITGTANGIIGYIPNLGSLKQPAADCARLASTKFNNLIKLAGRYIHHRGSLREINFNCNKDVVATLSVVLQAYCEEIVKRQHVMALLSILSVEGLMHGRKYIATAFMHVVSAVLPLPLGVALHSGFNTIVIPDTATEAVQYDDCVDEIELRPVEEPVGRSKLTVPNGYGLHDRLPCEEPKRAIYFSGLSVEGVRISVSRSCACNERAAVACRVTAVDHKHNPIWAKWWSKSSSIGIVPVGDGDEWERNISSCARGLIANGITSHDVRDKHARMDSFVKREKRISRVGSRTIKPDFAPRLIQGRGLNVKVCTGPFTWKYGKRLASVYNSDGRYLYAGGASAEQIGRFYDKFLNSGSGSWVAIDCKKWDRSVGPSVFEQLYKEYDACGAPAETLESCRDRMGIRVGKTKHGIHYERIAQVSSGDGDTSCGNSRAHLVLLEACDSVNAAIVSGDDALIHTNDIDSVMCQYVMGGLTPVLAKELDFCSQLLWPTDAGHVLGPKIGRILGKTFICINHYSGDGYQKWLRGTCLSLAKSVSYIPILRVLFPRLLELLGLGDKIDDGHDKYKSRSTEYHSCCAATWTVMLDRYDLTESEVVLLEEEVAQVNIGDELVGPDWLHIVDVDA